MGLLDGQIHPAPAEGQIALVLAADAFDAFRESGIFDRATARRFRSQILEVGGSRDIMEAFVAFRGRRPTIDALLRQCGIDAG